MIDETLQLRKPTRILNRSCRCKGSTTVVPRLSAKILSRSVSKPLSTHSPQQFRLWATVNDDENNEAEQRRESLPIQNDDKDQQSKDSNEMERIREHVKRTRNVYADITTKDKLAYERLIIEGADVENAEEEMQSLPERLAILQDAYQTGAAYESAKTVTPVPMKRLEDFDYPPMPEFSMSLIDLLQDTELREHVEGIRTRRVTLIDLQRIESCVLGYDNVTVTGMESSVERVKPGDLFFAKGNKGVEKISMASDKGAVAIVVQREDEIDNNTTDSATDDTMSQLRRNGTGQLINNSNDNTDWMRPFSEKGLPIETIAERIPIIPVTNLNIAMGELGYVFYGFRHSYFDAHYYVKRCLGFPSSRMKVIGVVGSHGKTSTAWILRQIIEEHDIDSAILCDIEHAINDDHLTVEGDLFIPDEPDHTTYRRASSPYHLTPFTGRYYIESAIPDALQVQKVLAGMAYRGALGCVIECPVDALMEGRLTFIEFDLLVQTNLQADRRDTEETFKIHKEICTTIFSRLTNPEWQRAIINIDDPHAQAFINKSNSVPIVTYSVGSAKADVYTESVSYSVWESEIVIQTPLGKMQLITPMLGPHHIENILAAVATAISTDIDLQTIVTAIESLDCIPGRYELVDLRQSFPVIVDLANTAQRITAMASNLRKCGYKRIFIVFGCSWYHSTGERKAMGNAAYYAADVLIITSDSPREQPPNQVIDDIISGFPEDVLNQTGLWVHSPWQDPGRVPWWFEEWLFRAQGKVQRHVIEDRCLAIRGAIGTAKPGDVVVIAGRGSRDYSWWVDKDDIPMKSWFEDRKEAKDALKKLSFLRKSRVVTNRLPWTQPKKQSKRRRLRKKARFP